MPTCTLFIITHSSVIIDSHLFFNIHVNSLCEATYYRNTALCHVRPCLTQSLAYTVACTIFGAKLDYCNSLLHSKAEVMAALKGMKRGKAAGPSKVVAEMFRDGGDVGVKWLTELHCDS
jgi:hypothetical protein